MLEHRIINMKRSLIIAGLLVCMTSLYSCYYDKEEVVYPSNPNPAGCDTASMTYTSHIQSIISANCYSCHQNASGSAGISLGTYADLLQYAQNGHLVMRITSTDPSIMMPKGGPRLPDCDISKIQAWVNAGAPQ